MLCHIHKWGINRTYIQAMHDFVFIHRYCENIGFPNVQKSEESSQTPGISEGNALTSPLLLFWTCTHWWLPSLLLCQHFLLISTLFLPSFFPRLEAARADCVPLGYSPLP